VVVGAFFKVYNTLGYGFNIKAEHKRKVYDNERKGTLTWLTPMPAIP
jgi:hypothetical protein